MSASIPMSHEPRLTLITTESVSQFQQAKGWLARLWGKIIKAPGRFWGWLKKTLHLQPAVDQVKGFGKWAWEVYKKTAAHFGWAGAGASGLLMLSTKTGRSLFSTFIGKPLAWLGRGLRSFWYWTEDKFVNNFGSPGTWIANRMADIDEFFFGSGIGKTAKPGVFGTIKAFWNKHIATHMDLNNALMRFLRLAGTCVMGVLLVDGLALLPLGGALMAAQWVTALAIGGSALWQGFYLGRHISLMAGVQEFFANNGTKVRTKRVDFAGRPTSA